MNTRAILFSLGVLCLSPVVWADTPFDGSWRLNASKSQMAGDTMSFSEAGGGNLQYTDSDQSYSFKPDGTPFTTHFGIERTFKKNADGTYSTTNKKGGFLINSSTWKISDDGNTIVIDSKGTKPNGDSFENVTTYVRTAQGTGLIGGWKSTDVKLGSPNTLTIQTSGNDITLTISAIKATCHAKWDGKDHPATGPTIGNGITLAVTRTSPNSFKLVEKGNNRVLAIINYRVADDGKTMAASGTNGEGKEPFNEVWEKQS